MLDSVHPDIERRRHPNQWRFEKKYTYEKKVFSRTSGKNSGKNTKMKNWRAPIGQAVEPEGYQDWTQPRFPTLFPVNSLFTGVITKLTGIS